MGAIKKDNKNAIQKGATGALPGGRLYPAGKSITWVKPKKKRPQKECKKRARGRQQGEISRNMGA